MNHSEPTQKTGLAHQTVAVTLSSEREGNVCFQFKAPGWDNLAASANRLLKFEFPPIREIKVYERLIKTNVLSTGLSKKALETLPRHYLEIIYAHLWQAWFGDQTQLADEWLSLFLLAEDLDGFLLPALVQQDIEQIGLRDTGATPSYYYQGDLNREQMATFLARHGYRTDFLTQQEGPDAGSGGSLALLYLVCRRLTHILPWTALLQKLEPAEVERYPRLAYLKAIYEALGQKGWLTQSISPQTVLKHLNALSLWLNHKDFTAFGAACHQARPVKALLIVEGETEKLLLPVFAKAMNLDFDRLGIHLLPAGGKNHVLSIYRQQAKSLNCPIFTVLDQDAADIAAELRANARKGDYIFSIEEGEFEDIYDLSLVVKTINTHYQPYPEVTMHSLQTFASENQIKGRVQTLRALWQAHNLGSFDKVRFATQYAETFQQIGQAAPVPPPKAIRRLIETILTIRYSAKAHQAF
ncbi:ATP-dependent endonuclease [Vampirovibrio chlorellavorus]|uniref:ATP-dependent endonuclease n=1 Tax=Vampirovibrio chlorellavorus TaxID=758823 RepID=UPI0026F35632|nr:ATP-dependent endonuclease [Vampirovibrio chlorellavorus]